MWALKSDASDEVVYGSEPAWQTPSLSSHELMNKLEGYEDG